MIFPYKFLIAVGLCVLITHYIWSLFTAPDYSLPRVIKWYEVDIITMYVLTLIAYIPLVFFSRLKSVRLIMLIFALIPAWFWFILSIHTLSFITGIPVFGW